MITKNDTLLNIVQANIGVIGQDGADELHPKTVMAIMSYFDIRMHHHGMRSIVIHFRILFNKLQPEIL